MLEKELTFSSLVFVCEHIESLGANPLLIKTHKTPLRQTTNKHPSPLTNRQIRNINRKKSNLTSD